MNKELSFIERKQIYLGNLIYYKPYVQALKSVKDTLDVYNIIIDPKNEKELDYSISYLGFILDSKEVMENAINNGSNIDVSNSILVNYISDYINAVKSNSNKQELLSIINKYNLENPKVVAKLNYELMIVNNDAFLDEIANRTFNGEFDGFLGKIKAKILGLKLRKAFISLKENIIDINSTKDLDSFIEFSKEFNRLKEESKQNIINR